MKELTIASRAIQCSLSDIERLEQEFDMQLPEYLKNFILQYGGTRVYEDWVNKKWHIEDFFAPYRPNGVDMAMIIPRLREISGDECFDVGRYDLVPLASSVSFAYFYISIGKDDNGIIYTSRFDDDERKIILDVVADSLEVFVNNLERDVEQDREGMCITGATQIGYWAAGYILNKDYKEGIRVIKLADNFQKSFECIKLCLKDNRWGYMDNPLPIFAQLGINLKENTVAEAYKWVELLVQNLEVEDESQIIEYPLTITEQETAALLGGGYAFNMITYHNYFRYYGEAISGIKLELMQQHNLINWNHLKKGVSERCLDAYKDSDLNVSIGKSALTIFHKARVRLREDTEAEAYKWLELLIRNVELEDESQIIEYPLVQIPM